MLFIDNARETLVKIKECAIDAGIYHAWFLAFGTCLGAVRPSKRSSGGKVIGFIEHDDDMDIGVFENLITKEQELEYINLLKSRGLFKYRSYEEHHQLREGGRHVWFSLRKDDNPPGTRCCHWMFFKHNGYWWHSKGKNWVVAGKFNVGQQSSDAAVALGILDVCLDSGTIEIDFEGGKYQVPALAGMCCDFWYPGWSTPRNGGASSKKVIMVIGNWSDSKTWKIK